MNISRQRRVSRTIGLWLVVAALLAAPRVGQAAPAHQDPGLTLTLSAGFDGYYKDGLWTPVNILVENNGQDVSGQVRVVNPRGYGSGETVVTRAVDLPTQSRRYLQLFVAPEGFNSSLNVELVNGAGQRLAAAPVRLSQLSANDLLFGLVANTSSAYAVLNDVDPVNGRAAIAQLDIQDLPALGATWQALSASAPNYSLAISPSYAADRTLWAVYREIEASAMQPEAGIVRSTDGGAAWSAWTNSDKTNETIKQLGEFQMTPVDVADGDDATVHACEGEKC